MLLMAQTRAREPNCVQHIVYCEYVLVQLLRSSFSFYRKNKADYSTRNRKFKRLEPRFQTSATSSAPKEDTECAVALAHSRECIKELISALPNFGSMGAFGARAEKRNVLRKNNAGRRGSSVFVVGSLAI